MSQRKHCCDMHKKIALQIAKVYTEEECGIPDSVMVDYHDFGYRSKTNLKVAASLSFKFCPWCGSARDDNDQSRRIVETIISTS